MAENIKLNKTVYNSTQFLNKVDTTFNQLGIQSTQEQLDEQPDLNQFFSMYSDLFYQIPITGSTNQTHEYLIKESSEYANFKEDNEILTLLQQEISQLREELLQTQIENSNLHLSASLNI